MTITAAQRDAVYDQLLDRLSGIGDIELAIQAEKYDAAERLGREYSDDLLLLLDDLGVGPGDGEPVQLTSPPDLLRRVLPRLRQLAEGMKAGQEAAWTESQALRHRTRLVADACDRVLSELKP